MKIEILYFAGCPNHQALHGRLCELMTEAGADTPIELRAIESAEHAQRERFLGSPTLRINGEDADPAARERTDYGLKCRLYPTPEGLRGTVPDELLRTALRRRR